MAEPPNILFIHTDEQRADTLGCYGNDFVRTPHLDGLADDGVTFEEGHCTHPLCSPSRATFLTGRYPSTHGLWRNGIPLSRDEPTVADRLRAAGYATGLIGKGHVTPYYGDPDVHPESVQRGCGWDETDIWAFWRDFDGPYYGFDEVELSLAHGPNTLKGGHYGLWLNDEHPDERALFYQDAAVEDTDPTYNSWRSAAPVELHSSTWVADRTIEFIETHAGEQPFFGWVGIPDPHFPYDPPAAYADRYDLDDIPLPVDSTGEVWGDEPPMYVQYHLEEKYGTDWREIPTRKQREIIAHYWAMVDLVDDQVGRILTALEAAGVAEDTIVVFTSDHGDWLGDHGLFQKGIPHTRELTRIPWIVRWPGVAEPGRRIEAPTSHVDLGPTLLDAAGVEVPYGMQGAPLRPVLEGEREANRPFALVEHRHEAFREDHPLVRRGDDGGVPEMTAMQDNLVNWGEEDIHVKTVYAEGCRCSYVTGTERPWGELFDHTTDLDELDNLWWTDDELRGNMLGHLAEALIHADDPLPEREYAV